MEAPGQGAGSPGPRWNDGHWWGRGGGRGAELRGPGAEARGARLGPRPALRRAGPLTVHGRAGGGALADGTSWGASDGGRELPGCPSLPVAGPSRERTAARPARARGVVAVATAPPRPAAAFVSQRRGAPAEEPAARGPAGPSRRGGGLACEAWRRRTQARER